MRLAQVQRLQQQAAWLPTHGSSRLTLRHVSAVWLPQHPSTQGERCTGSIRVPRDVGRVPPRAGGPAAAPPAAARAASARGRVFEYVYYGTTVYARR